MAVVKCPTMNAQLRKFWDSYNLMTRCYEFDRIKFNNDSGKTINSHMAEIFKREHVIAPKKKIAKIFRRDHVIFLNKRNGALKQCANSTTFSVIEELVHALADAAQFGHFIFLFV